MTLSEGELPLRESRSPDPLSAGPWALLQAMLRWRSEVGVFVRARGGALVLSVLLLVLMTALVVSVGRGLAFRARVEALRDTPIWMLPVLHLRSGVLEAEGAVPRTFSTEAWVVHLDTRPDAEMPPRAEAGDRRPRFFLRDRALLIYDVGSPVARVLPWQAWQVFGDPLRIDGPGLIDVVASMWLPLSGLAALLGGSLASVAALLLATMMGSLWAMVAGRGPRSPSRAAYVRIALAAVGPGVLLGGAAVLLGLSQTVGIGVGATAAAFRFLRLAPGARLGDDPSPA